MRKLLRKILSPLLTRLASNASAPDAKEVFSSLSKLLRNLKERPGTRGIAMEVNFSQDKFIIFSDQHKGNKDHSDDFASNEPNYLAALDHYLTNKFSYINLGDCEELWKYTPSQVIPKYITALKSEAAFQNENTPGPPVTKGSFGAGRYYKTFGNHDIIWKNKLDVDSCLKNIFTLPLPVWEGILLTTKIKDQPLSIFLTHGHQGDKLSDNNALSTWLVAHVWRTVQRYLQINVNTPAKDFMLRDKHNIMMHEWSNRRKNLLLITGHTHKPVFASGRYSDHPNNNILPGKQTNGVETVRPCYFNSGCCCYNDGDITGIEIADSMIRLVKWHWNKNASERIVLEEISLQELVDDLRK